MKEEKYGDASANLRLKEEQEKLKKQKKWLKTYAFNNFILKLRKYFNK